MTYAYSMDNAMQVAKQAAADIETWLWAKPETISVTNVENNPDYQRTDIDLIWTIYNRDIWVEIKGDRWNKTRNFFFETHSNLEKGTPGCFMYTQADWLFYYFVNPRQLYRLPMPKTREWFLITMQRFKERATKTLVGDSHYTTVGRLVPIAVVMLEVPGVKMEPL